MSSIVWNARGLGCRCVFRYLQQLVANLKPLLLFVSKSRITCKTVRTWIHLLNFNSVFGVDPVGSRGGLLLFWSNKIDVTLHSYSFSHIDVYVK